MASEGRVLIIGGNADGARSGADALGQAGLETVVASGVNDAIKKLRGQPFDLILVGTGLERPSAAEFLAKARLFVPRALRALYEEKPLEEDLRQLVNAVAPCAILPFPPDPGQVLNLVQTHRKAFPPTNNGQTNGAYSPRDVVAMKARLAHLETENARLARQAGASPVTPLPTLAAAPVSALTGAAAEEAPVPNETGGLDVGNLLGGGEPLGIDHLRNPAQVQEAVALEPEVVAAIEQIDSLFERPDIRLPVLPAVGVEVQKLIADDNVSFDKIAEKVSLDASMSSRILEVANSPLYAGVEQVRSIQNAVSRIGIRETRNILQAVLAEGLFKTNDEELAKVMGALWLHSLAVAYSNEILAKALFIAESEDFFMMGLLHDIGKLLIIHLVQEGVAAGIWTQGEIGGELLQKVMNAHHNDIGRRLLEKWEYPEAFYGVVELHNDDADVYKYEEPVVVTYYSNVLARKVGLSLRPHIEALLDNKQIAQSLNMSDEARTKVAEVLTAMVDKIKQSYLQG